MRYSNKDAEKLRITSLYRRLIRSKKLDLRLKEAKGLVGPDTAYHLYQRENYRDKNNKP